MDMDFLWHKVSDKEREEIKEGAEKIMKNFSKKLASIPLEIKSACPDSSSLDRLEGTEKIAEMDKEIMFANAPNKNDDSIIAEKKSW